MSRHLLLLFAGLTLVFTACPGFAQTHEFKDKGQSLEVDLPLGHLPQYGFQLVRLTATNSGNKKAVWEISITEDGYNMGDFTESYGKHGSYIEVPPGGSTQRDVLLALGSPHIDNYGGNSNNLKVNVVTPSGIRDSWRNRTSYDGHMHTTNTNAPTLVGEEVSRIMPHVFRTDICKVLKTSNAPTDWRAYTPFRLVILTKGDWTSMKPDARLALAEWIRLGGILQYHDEAPSDAIKPDIVGEKTYGLGEIYGPEKESNRKDLSKYPAINKLELEGIPGLLGSATHKSLLREWLRQSDPMLLRDKFTIWPVILVLIAFFVMITPINLFVLAPSRRRHRLIKTIPAISIIACLALAFAVFIGDGTGGEGRRMVLIEVEHGTENRHYISQWQASQCGAIFGNSFKIEEQAYIEPIHETGTAASLTINADVINASGGWFASRSIQSHHIQAVRPSRGRIEWTHSQDQSPRGLSTFDFPIQDIYVRSSDGTWWHASSMEQGKETKFHAIDHKDAVNSIQDLALNAPFEENRQHYLQVNGRFFAFTDSPPAIETLGSIDWIDAGIITGPLLIK